MSETFATNLANATVVDISDASRPSRVQEDTQTFDVAALRDATVVDPSKLERAGLVKDMPPITKAGVNLAKTVLWFIAITVVLILGLITSEEFSGDKGYSAAAYVAVQELSKKVPLSTDPVQNTNYQRSVEDTKSLIEEVNNQRRDTRDFMLKVAQLILLTLFLPILTALLGYIFGTQQAGAERSRS